MVIVMNMFLVKSMILSRIWSLSRVWSLLTVWSLSREWSCQKYDLCSDYNSCQEYDFVKSMVLYIMLSFHVGHIWSLSIVVMIMTRDCQSQLWSGSVMLCMSSDLLLCWVCMMAPSQLWCRIPDLKSVSGTDSPDSGHVYRVLASIAFLSRIVCSDLHVVLSYSVFSVREGCCFILKSPLLSSLMW
jgi:hypothetical protein